MKMRPKVTLPPRRVSRYLLMGDVDGDENQNCFYQMTLEGQAMKNVILFFYRMTVERQVNEIIFYRMTITLFWYDYDSEAFEGRTMNVLIYFYRMTITFFGYYDSEAFEGRTMNVLIYFYRMTITLFGYYYSEAFERLATSLSLARLWASLRQ